MRSIRITWAWVRANALAAASPPKPPPTITTVGKDEFTSIKRLAGLSLLAPFHATDNSRSVAEAISRCAGQSDMADDEMNGDPFHHF